MESAKKFECFVTKFKHTVLKDGTFDICLERVEELTLSCFRILFFVNARRLSNIRNCSENVTEIFGIIYCSRQRSPDLHFREKSDGTRYVFGIIY